MTNAASYIIGQCTYFVAMTLGWVPAHLGDAKDWLTNAKAQGYSFSSTPVVGSVVVYGTDYSPQGHVAIVTGIGQNGMFSVREANLDEKGQGNEDSRLSSMKGVLGFILPPTGSAQISQDIASNLPGGRESAHPLQGIDFFATGNNSPLGGISNPLDTMNPANLIAAIKGQKGGLETEFKKGITGVGFAVFGAILIFVGLFAIFQPQIAATGKAVAGGLTKAI